MNIVVMMTFFITIITLIIIHTINIVTTYYVHCRCSVTTTIYVTLSDLLFSMKGSRRSAVTQMADHIHTEYLVLLYDGVGGNVLTKETFVEMQQLENMILYAPGMKDFCTLNQFNNCHPFNSVLRFFDGTFSHIRPIFLDTDFKNISGVLHAAYQSPLLREELKKMLSNLQVTPTDNVTAFFTRSVYAFKKGLDEKCLSLFLRHVCQPMLDNYLSSKNFQFSYYSMLLAFATVRDTLGADLFKLVGSGVLICCFIFFHTGSIWATVCGLVSIAGSFFEANLVYRMLLDFKYFGNLHVVTMFIILGIGTDDLFVFYDTWQATAADNSLSLTLRLDKAYRKAGVSMFMTSLTTAMAFATNILSPTLVMKSFGAFSAVIVAVNYVNVITFFPAAIVYGQTLTIPSLCQSKIFLFFHDVKSVGRMAIRAWINAGIIVKKIFCRNAGINLADGMFLSSGKC